MSHFVVLVFGDDVEGQLAPYQENNMGDCPKQYMEFVDKTEELHKEWEEGTVEVVVMPDGSYKGKYDEEFKVLDPDSPWRNSYKYVVPDHLSTKEVLTKDTGFWNDFDEFAASEWHKDEDTGLYGYWENPNAKWDYWQFGGRWLGFIDKRNVNSLRKKHINIEKMRAKSALDAGAEYDEFHKIIGDIKWRTFTEFIDSIPGEQTNETRNTAYNEYVKQPELKNAKRKLNAQAAKRKGFITFRDIDSYLDSREKFVEGIVLQAFVPYAFVLEGKWYEKGEMGWWGMSNDKYSDEEWAKFFNETYDKLPDHTMVSVVDCHI